MTSLTAASAVAGTAVPGTMIPGYLAQAVPPGPAAVFAVGTPYFQWEPQEPYLS